MATMPEARAELLRRYQQLVEAAGDVIFSTDLQGFFTYVNASVERRYGYKAEALIGRHFTDLIHPEWRETVEAFYVRQFQKREAETVFEFPTMTGSGEVRWVEQTVILLTEGERVTGFQGIVRDVSERKRATEALIASEQRYRAMVETQRELVCRYQPDLKLTFVNETYCRYFNCHREDLIGKHLTDLVPPEYQEMVRQAIAYLQQNPQVATYEQPIISGDGKAHWIEWTDTPIYDEQGRVCEFQAVGRDISERKAFEQERDEYIQRLEILQRVDTEMSQILKFDHVLEVALDFAVRLSNANAGAIHLIEDGRLKVAAVIGNYPKSMIGSFVPSDTGLINRVLRTGWAEIVTDVKTDADYMPNVVETQAQITVPLKAQEKLIGVLNVQTDEPGRFTRQIFDFVKLLSGRIASALDNARLYRMLQIQYNELQDLYQQVSDLEQLKTQIIRIAAHDLRNPLGAIAGYLQMLNWELADKLDERSRDHLKVIQVSADRIEKISRDILTLERVQGTGRGIFAQTVDLRDLARAAYDEYREQAKEKRQSLKLLLPDEAMTVEGDRVLLCETMSNLVSNALKYTPDGGQVQIRLREDGGLAVFEVQDNGFGIPEDQQDKLFQPFSRIPTAETKQIRGTGLGLHLVKSIVERHHGQMRFQSVYGQGSTFGFTLPLHVEPVAASDAPTERHRPAGLDTMVRAARNGRGRKA